MLTLPRLTAVLRDALGSKRDIRDVSSPLFDVDAATIAREAELKRIRAAREAEAMGGGKSSSGTAFVPIRNTALLAEIIGAHLFNRLPKNEQELYNSFLRIVSLMLGGQMGTEELTESALLVYRLLIQSGAHAAFPDPSEPQEPNYGEDAEAFRTRQRAQQADCRTKLKAQLRKHFLSPVDELHLPSAISFAAPLRKLQLKYNPKGAAGQHEAEEKKGKRRRGDAGLEFGADLELQFRRLNPEVARPLQLGGDEIAVAPRARPDWIEEKADEPDPEAAFDEDDKKMSKRRVAAELKWLLQWINRSLDSGALANMLPMLEAADEGSDDLRANAFNTLSLLAVRAVIDPSLNPEEGAAELLEMVGYDNFDAVQDLLARKTDLGAALTTTLQKAMEEEGSAPRDAPAASVGGPEKSTGRNPAMVGTVTVMSEAEKKSLKIDRRNRRKGGRGGGRDAEADPVLDFLASYGFAALVQRAVDEAEGRDIGSRRMVFGDIEFAIGDGGPGMWTAGALPSGTTRTAYKGYEEIRVPAAKKSEMKPGERLVPISDLDDWAQVAFKGYQTLNRIQSRIYDCAYHSNQNMLVCAPTGAGKTNIAMLAVLHEVGNNLRDGLLRKQDFKVVYVAPMKALAAEVTAAFSQRLGPLGLTVRELTGDMQLTKREMEETQMLVTTPEKWDVITRKGGDVAVASLVRLLILDEVHLLNDDRGPVIETLVARTQRLVETSQSMIRIVGLSATLPNYRDVATFLGVNLDTGLFYFDASYRPVPLEMQFLGISEPGFMARTNLMNELAYQKVVDALKRGYQAMVFVHSRKDTGKTGRILAEMAGRNGENSLFDTRDNDQHSVYAGDVRKSRNREVQELFDHGIGIHHAGMLRPDRTLTETLFSKGLIKVLCCTATLAWGVNLPAHTVIIKGTQVYNAEKGGFTEVSLLDVQQIFGRAGRPQFESSGEGIILTTHKALPHYLGMLTHQLPIESSFTKGIVDHLNAEVVLGTVTNVREAAQWLSYTYMYVRMLKNPLHYAITWQQLAEDPRLDQHRRKLITEAARELERTKMCRFDEKSGNLYVTELGRVASHFYLSHKTVDAFNDPRFGLRQHMEEKEIFSLISKAAEFEQLTNREDEMIELESMLKKQCPLGLRGGLEAPRAKANILIQAYVSRFRPETFSLVADSNYVASNAPRIARALFEIAIKRGWATLTEQTLTVCKSLEKQIWPHQHALRQFESSGLPYEVFQKLEDKNCFLNQLWDMEAAEIGALIRHPFAGKQIRDCLALFPHVELDCLIQPVTRSVLRIQLTLTPAFDWSEKLHGQALRWWILVEDSETEMLYHTEMWTLTKKMAKEGAQKVSFTIPVYDPLPTQYFIRAVSDDWLHAENEYAVSFKGLVLPDLHPPYTDLYDLDPLPRSALHNEAYERLYEGKFDFFNPIQTQAFHTLYNTDENVLLGAPTGSGKTVTAELTMLRLFSKYPGQKVIYIAPLKALVRERMTEWGKGLCKALDKKLVELTGDYTPDLRALLAADVIIATPEKWDGISRNWQSRSYVQKVGLLVIDEIHLLGADRGPILEVIVSRMRYISAQTGRNIRFVGLSTALANAHDLGAWLGITGDGLFNFRPSVRPCPLEVHIQGYPGKFYCPRMISMNKPTYAAIQTHSPDKPVLVFVSSRRQTRLTALDLIAFAAADERPNQFVNMPEEELEYVLDRIKDPNLRHAVQFGIGLHHAGLAETDRSLVEELFVACKIQVLVATSTLAWGVNTPTHLVVVKGTEFFDAPTKRYVDFPITDVLQMMGRAGRPQYNEKGIAVIMVHEPKKQFYKRFLYDPFPVESSLAEQLADHLNAEVVGGTIKSKQDAVDYLTWTYLYRRVVQNPSYYGLEEASADGVSLYFSNLIEGCLLSLEESGCVVTTGEEEGHQVEATPMGRIASFYYLQHSTMQLFMDRLGYSMSFASLLKALSDVPEYAELPVRHNEDSLNAVLAREVRLPVDLKTVDSPHTKALLLLQCHLGRLPLPISDYVTDTKSVLDNALRVLQAMVDVAAEAGWLETALGTMSLVQSIMQARWPDDPGAALLPHLSPAHGGVLAKHGFPTLAAMAENPRAPALRSALEACVAGRAEVDEILRIVERLPTMALEWSVQNRVQRTSEAQEAAAASARTQESEDASDPYASIRGGNSTWTIEVALARVGAAGGAAGRGPPRVYAPKYPKVKEECWWLVAGHAGSGELLALKRISCGARVHTSLKIPATLSDGKMITEAALYLVSDSYLGLDREWTVQLPVRGGETKGPRGTGAVRNSQLPMSTASNKKKFVPVVAAVVRPGGAGGEEPEGGAEYADEACCIERDAGAAVAQQEVASARVDNDVDLEEGEEEAAGGVPAGGSGSGAGVFTAFRPPGGWKDNGGSHLDWLIALGEPRISKQ